MTVVKVNNAIQSKNTLMMMVFTLEENPCYPMKQTPIIHADPWRLELFFFWVGEFWLEVSLKGECLCRWECEHQGTLYVYSGFDRLDGGLHVRISVLSREADGHVPQWRWSSQAQTIIAPLALIICKDFQRFSHIMSLLIYIRQQ